ncbi:hypothetical protein OS493_031741 [Desmophyllum pertusum]|uniref:Fibronectin type-III domain-containing protein n=1 Tax=Desmophyllum pertusum TaxID=174260 RepID=A0A9X0D137_9CNID|nr:hypothetical protein OS493_031741 [Desmophyllum pertusum]
MGIVCSGPSKNFINPTMNGENEAFTEGVVVRVSDEGFCPSRLVLYEGQCILFEWNVERPSPGFNVIQVSGTSELTHVPGGYSSGSPAYSGSFKVCLGRQGQFNFARFVEFIMHITDGGFEQQLVNIHEGDSIQWSCENEDSEILCYMQEMELEVKSAYARTFHNTGLYYFCLENYDTDWVEDEVTLICVIKVTQMNREFLVHASEEGLQPSLISARVQDRIWLECAPSRIRGSRILDVCLYKDPLASPLVTAKLSGSSRIAELVSHQFIEPGLYHYVYYLADLSKFCGCVVVQPKPKEHVINVTDPGQFQPALVYQGERVWWTLKDGQNISFNLKELDCCTPPKGLPTRRKSLSSGCGCKKLEDQENLMSLLGMATRKFDEIGVFTYCMLQGADSESIQSNCSVVVQTSAKHHTVKVHDQGFTPRILNVHPGDWVWWQWESTKRPHNITQVSALYINIPHNITQVSHQRISMPGGFDSGKPTCSTSAFTNVFTELGVFYFASNGLPEVFGAVVIHKIDVTVQGVQRDPLVISANDCVSWMWFDGESYSVQETSQLDDTERTVIPLPQDHNKRCYTRVFNKPGMYHFLCTAHREDESEVHSQNTESFIHSVLVDPVSYSCMVGVTADGFKPSTLTIGKCQSVLWTWENQRDKEHNILHVRPPQAEQPLARVRGLSAFDSGPKTTRSTFFHTFDVPGRYFITSEGTDRQLCTIDVLDKAAHVSPPTIPAAEKDGGNQYKTKKGIVLAQAGLVVIRAIAKKHGWVTSHVYTSKRFRVEGDNIQESGEEVIEQHLETGSEEVDLKEEIFKWHWLSCRPNITVELVCDNTFNIYVTLGNAADLTWIKGFQLFLNGTPYGGWFSPHCRGLVVSGLIGGKVYHVVLVVFATHDSFEPQLSNEVVISCPLQASSGGPLVSLEAATTPQSLVIVWPAYCDPNTVDVTAYSVFINGQPFGEQIIAEADSAYCRVLFESSLQHEVYTLCVASHLSVSDVLLYSNEVEFSLPVPEEILSALHKPTDEDDSVGSDEREDGESARELLLVAERLIPESCVAEQSGIEKLSLKSLLSKLPTILEDQQLDVMIADADAQVTQNVLFTENGDTKTEPAEQQSDLDLLDRLEAQKDPVEDEHVPVDEETGLEYTPHDTFVADELHVQDDACSAMVVELDTSIFRDLDESVSGRDANLEPLIGDACEDELDKESHVGRDSSIVGNERQDKDSLNQHENQENSKEQVADQSEVTCHATVGNEESETRTNLDNEAEAFGMERVSNEQSDTDFWDHGEKTSGGRNNEGRTGHPNRTKDIDFQDEHPYIESHDTEKRKEHDVQEDSYSEGLEHVAYNVNTQEGEAVEESEVGLDTNGGVIPDSNGESNEKECRLPENIHSNSEINEVSKPGNVAERDDDTSAANLESDEKCPKDVVHEENTQLSLGIINSEEPSENREYKDDNDGNDELAVDEEADRELNSENPLEENIAGAVQVLQESPNSVSLVENNDISLVKEREEGEDRNNGRFREDNKSELPSENVMSGGNQTMVARVKTQELQTENLTPDLLLEDQTVDTGDRTKESFETTSPTEGGKQTSNEVPRDTWSASSNHGSVKNEDDKIKDVMETTEMPMFEEEAFGVDVMMSQGNREDDESLQLDREVTERKEGRAGGTLDSLQGASHDHNPQDESQQLLPRPLLVIKGTTPITVTLEWEWTLLAEHIAGADIVYSVLILGSKFHSDINSSFCFNFEDSPAKTMWPKQSASLKQHVWRTTNTVIEITGLKQRCSYKLAVLGQLMPCANDCLSRVISFTMPGPPKPPLIHVTDLKDRKVTLTWKPPASFGEASVVGYRLLKDEEAFREDLDCETLSLSLSGLEEDKHRRFSLLALTGHSVGDSKPSNTIVIHCPTPPISPQIYHRESATVGSICIVWKHTEPASTDNPEKHAQYSYSVFVDDMLHGEYPLDGVTDIFTNEHTYTIPNCEVGRKYRLCVKSYLNPQLIDNGLGNKSGYVLTVNSKWSGELLPPEQQEANLTGFNPGDVIRVQIAAVTSDLGVPIPVLINQEGDKSRYFPPSYDPPDSGVESSSSFLSKGSADETKQFARSAGPPLVIQFSNLVRKVSSLEVTTIGCRSA